MLESLTGTKLQSLFTGTDSPVSMDSSTLKFLLSIKIMSAGTLSPSFKITISPTTIFLDGICISFPSLNTKLFTSTIFFNEDADLFAEYSCTVPIIALNETTTKIK